MVIPLTNGFSRRGSYVTNIHLDRRDFLKSGAACSALALGAGPAPSTLKTKRVILVAKCVSGADEFIDPRL